MKMLSVWRVEKPFDLLPSDHISVGGKYNVRESLLLACMISCDARLSRLDRFIVFARYACLVYCSIGVRAPSYKTRNAMWGKKSWLNLAMLQCVYGITSLYLVCVRQQSCSVPRTREIEWVISWGNNVVFESTPLMIL